MLGPHGVFCCIFLCKFYICVILVSLCCVWTLLYTDCVALNNWTLWTFTSRRVSAPSSRLRQWLTLCFQAHVNCCNTDVQWVSLLSLKTRLTHCFFFLISEVITHSPSTKKLSVELCSWRNSLTPELVSSLYVLYVYLFIYLLLRQVIKDTILVPCEVQQFLLHK